MNRFRTECAIIQNISQLYRFSANNETQKNALENEIEIDLSLSSDFMLIFNGIIVFCYPPSNTDFLVFILYVDIEID